MAGSVAITLTLKNPYIEMSKDKMFERKVFNQMQEMVTVIVDACCNPTTTGIYPDFDSKIKCLMDTVNIEDAQLQRVFRKYHQKLKRSDEGEVKQAMRTTAAKVAREILQTASSYTKSNLEIIGKAYRRT